jgi:hypothetical protein
MRKIQFSLSIGFSGAEHRTVIEFPDDATDEQIEAEYEIWCQNYMDGGWWDVNEEQSE